MGNTKIKMADIKTAPWNARKGITPESVKGLAKSIEETGLINPITLWESPDGAMYCIAGNRRLEAFRHLGIEEITEGVDFMFFVGDENDARQVTITENLQREDIGVLEEAALVESLVDLGMTAHQVAAQIGRPESWVSRRKKLLALDEAWKGKADGMTADALERIAEYPADVQKSVAKKCTYPVKTWKDVASYFSREDRGLDSAKFDTDACRACTQRTGQNTDLFGEVEDDGLGNCLCAKCYDRKLKAHQDECIRKATEAADEVVRLKWEWEMPNDATDERTDEHPCAYVCVKWDGEVLVRWGESKKAKDEREAKEREEREAANAEENERHERLRNAVNRLGSAFSEPGEGEENDARFALEQELRLRIEGKADAETDMLVRFAMDALADDYGYRRYEEWADICRALPFVPTLAGIAKDELDEFLSEYPATEE